MPIFAGASHLFILFCPQIKMALDSESGDLSLPKWAPDSTYFSIHDCNSASLHLMIPTALSLNSLSLFFFCHTGWCSDILVRNSWLYTQGSLLALLRGIIWGCWWSSLGWYQALPAVLLVCPFPITCFFPFYPYYTWSSFTSCFPWSSSYTSDHGPEVS